jgi:hypothetical protein
VMCGRGRRPVLDQHRRLRDPFTVDKHVEVESTCGIYQPMIAAYREPDQAGGRELMKQVINGRLEYLRGSALGFRNLTSYTRRITARRRRLQTASSSDCEAPVTRSRPQARDARIGSPTCPGWRWRPGRQTATWPRN